MTWRFGVGQPSLQQWVATCLAFSAILGACGDDDAPTKSLVVTAPMADAELSMADDADAAIDGLQYQVMITTTGLAAGTELRVLIGEGDQEKQVGTAEVSTDGTATTIATLDPGQKSIFVKTENAEITSDATQSYILRMLEITSPMAGVIDGDANPSQPGAQVNVSVAAYAITGELILSVDGTDLVGSATIADGVAVFGVTLEAGTHTLVAKSDALESAAVEVSVMRQCGSLVLISPRAASDGRLVLGGDDNSCPAAGESYTSTFEVSTDIGDGLAARLFVNGNMLDEATVDQTLVTFENVALPDLSDSAGTVRVEIDAPEGTCNRTFDLELYVDCAGPGCTIVSPTPFEVTEGTTTTAYLNRALGNGEYTVEVSSDTEVIGRDIELIVDGNTANPLTMQAADDSGTALATFEDVALADGNHSVRARCTDANGNVTMSAEKSWMVDTTPCSVAISSPAGNTSIYTDDDANGSVDGTQYAVSATVTGGDCQNSRAAECNPANGIADGAFSTFVDGAEFEVTLSTALTSQSLCVEVQDRAGNIGLGAVQVDHYDETRPIPDCAIVSPMPFVGADLTEYLSASASAGGGMFTVEVASSASTIGQAIELLIDGNANPATATAVVDGAGAKAMFSVLLPDGDHSLVASCTAPGGVPRLSAQKDWKVDTTPCTVALTSPVVATNVFLDDDADGATDGIQTPVAAMMTGAGCVAARANPCDSTGSFVEDYVDNDPLLVTLLDAVVDQELCVESRDQAGNVGVGSVAIQHPQTNRPIPSCAIVSPLPFAGTDGNEYLNSDTSNAGTFTVEVDTVSGAIGESIELVIDDNTAQKLTATAVENGGGATATFAVSFSEGAHTVVANCVDDNGTPNVSLEENWIVDTQGCDVALTSLSAGAKFILADDADGGATGTQLLLDSTVTGPSCTAARAAPCDGAAIPGNGFPLFTPGNQVAITLDADNVAQTLCLEVRDIAGNVTIDSVAVEHFSRVPVLSVLSPADGVHYNNLGNDGPYNSSDIEDVSAGTLYQPNAVFDADEDGATAACQATFTVACSEIGLPAELIRQASNGVSADVVLGTADCIAGQAVFSEISFQDLADQAATFSAVQTYSGDSGDQGGAALPINVDGQCDVLVLTYSSNLVKAGGGAPTPLISCPSRVGTSGVTVEATVNMLPAVGGLATLTALDGAGADVTMADNVQPGGAGAFSYFGNGVDFGSATSDMANITVNIVDDFNNAASASCNYSVSDSNLALGIAVASPPATTSFTVATAGNAACPNSGTGQFQVPLVLTIDGDSQASPGDRTLAYSVNGGSTVSVPAANAGQVLCADVPEGASIVQGTLQDNLSSDQDSQQISVTVDTLNVTAPVAGDKFAGANVTGCTGNQTLVTANFHAVYPDNEPVTILTGLGSLNTTVQNGAISVCVGMAAGPQSVVVTVPSTGATETVANVTFLNTPTIDNVSFSVGMPLETLPAYRTTPIDITWTLPTGGFYEFVKYEFKCDPSALDPTDNNTKNNWWNAAQSHLFADGTTSRFTATGTDATAGVLELATGGIKLHCVLRLCDASDRCTAIPDASTEVEKPFRSLLVDGTVAGELMGSSIEPVGDVNGDGVNDALISAPTTDGADSAVYLYFGVASGAPNPTPGVKITSAPIANFDSLGPFGRDIAGLGDVNGDGRPDFAVTRPFANFYSGMVYVFFGRESADPWPTEIDLDAGTNASGCDADLCIQQIAGPAGTSAINFGSAVAGVGDFDGVPPNDIAIGASYTGTNVSGVPDGALYVILGEAFASCSNPTCDNRADDTWGISVDVQPGASTDVDGFYTTLVDAGGASFGERVVAVGNMDGSGDSTDDLVVVATSTHTIYSLVGRAHSGVSGLDTIDFSEVSEVYDGSAFPNFSAQVRALGNVFDPPGGGGTTVGVPDLGVWSNFASGMYVFPGDTNLSEGFDTAGANVMYIQGDAGTVFGKRGCTGLFPALPGLTNDIDGDGMTDFCVAGEEQDGVNPPGAGYYFPGDTIMSQTRDTGAPQGSSVQFQHIVDRDQAGGVFNPGTSSTVATETGVRTPQVVGDLTGDGAPDLLMGDVPVSTATETEGGFWLLY